MRLTKIILCFSLAAALFGCQGQPPKPQETQTQGRILVKGSDGMLKLMRRQSQAFMQLYPKAEIVVDGGGSKAGIAALNEGLVRIAVMTRELTAQEDSIIRANGGQPKSYKIALDGMAVIVHKTNRVGRLDLDQLAGIFSGRITDWSKLGGRPGKIVPVYPAPNSGGYEFFRDRVLGGGDFAAKSYPCSTTAQAVELVKEHHSAVGLVTMSALFQSWDVWPPVRQPGIRAVSIGFGKERGYFAPNQKTVNDGEYPLTRPVYLVVNEALEKTYSQGMSSLAHGFISFVSSAEGQKLVAQQGLVPATMPVIIKK
jgi:phosphate transport system substrate-binding protein